MKKMLKFLVTLVLICIIALTVFFAYVCIEHAVPDKMNYIVNADQETCTITGAERSPGFVLYIPKEINGYTVTKIASMAFHGSNFYFVILPETIESIGAGAFIECEKLISIDGLEKCTKLIEIKDETFSGCHYLDEITLPQGLEKIGEHAFAFCYDLSSIDIPSTVTIIDNGAFALNNRMTKIKIPASVEYIGLAAFEGCMCLKSIEVEAQNPNYCSVDGVLYSKDMTTIYAYPCSKEGNEFTISESVTTIVVCAFSYPRNLETLNIPSSVKNIEKDAIKDPTNISALFKINYNGTVEMWNSINKDPDWAWRYLPDYTIYCTDGKIKKDGTVIYN